MEINKRIEEARKVMEKYKVDAYIVTSSDYHQSEYIDDYFKGREYLSGFTGSAGVLVIFKDEACLWTDGRYHIQAEKQLKGSEVKSIKAGKVSIKESFVRIINDEIFIMGMSVVPWEFGSVYNPEERRVRKLLLHRKEIKKIHEKVKIKGYTIVPLDVHLSKGYVKIQIAIAKGKKTYDKRESIAKKDQERNLKREFKNNNR